MKQADPMSHRRVPMNIHMGARADEGGGEGRGRGDG
jgi:hypothetical protein